MTYLSIPNKVILWNFFCEAHVFTAIPSREKKIQAISAKLKQLLKIILGQIFRVSMKWRYEIFFLLENSKCNRSFLLGINTSEKIIKNTQSFEYHFWILSYPWSNRGFAYFNSPMTLKSAINAHSHFLFAILT